MICLLESLLFKQTIVIDHHFFGFILDHKRTDPRVSNSCYWMPSEKNAMENIISKKKTWPTDSTLNIQVPPATGLGKISPQGLRIRPPVMLQCFKAHFLTSFGKLELHEAGNPGCFMTEPGILQIHGWWNLEIYLRVGNLTHLWPCNVGFHFLIGHPNLNLHLPRPDIGRFFCSPISPAKPLTTSLSYDHPWNLCEKENNAKTQAIFPPAFCPAGT